MLKKINILTAIKFGLIAAALFAIPVFIYVRDTSYSQSWLLYLGSALFCAVIAVYTLFFNKTRQENANTFQMVVASHATVIFGVLFSCLFCFAMLALLVPGYLSGGTPEVVSGDSPSNTIHGQANGIGFRVFMGAILINFFFGGFAALLFPFSAKGDQTKNAGETRPQAQRGTA